MKLNPTDVLTVAGVVAGCAAGLTALFYGGRGVFREIKKQTAKNQQQMMEYFSYLGLDPRADQSESNGITMMKFKRPKK